MNVVFNITGDINEEAYDRLCEFLAGQNGKSVTIRINSGGGHHLDSLAMYSMLRVYPGKVTTHVVGSCFSAAVLVFIAGDYRLAAEESWFMVHEDAGELSGSLSALKTEIDAMEEQENQWCSIMEKRTGIGRRIWAGFSKGTTYMTGVDLINYKIIHNFLKEKA